MLLHHHHDASRNTALHHFRRAKFLQPATAITVLNARPAADGLRHSAAKYAALGSAIAVS